MKGLELKKFDIYFLVRNSIHYPFCCTFYSRIDICRHSIEYHRCYHTYNVSSLSLELMLLMMCTLCTSIVPPRLDKIHWDKLYNEWTSRLDFDTFLVDSYHIDCW
mgnify:CR=1 FL=1